MKINNQTPALDNYVRLGALRWLHGIDFREHSATYGIADREYWAWKTKDFPNGTMQAGIAGFLDAHSLLDFSAEQISRIVRANLIGTQTIQRSNGSFEEAYPYESSYAVTGLVLFELLYAYLSYPEFFSQDDKSKLDHIASKANHFLKITPETHGVISNHLASSVLSMELFHLYKGIKSESSDLENFIRLQKDEGWFPEYNGADPGYQTLLNSYLIRFLSIKSNDQLEHSLKKSLVFVSHFFFPSGDFAGEIGSRGTAIPYPASLTQDNFLIWFEQKYIPHVKAVTPVTIDTGNFAPLWNSWSFASTKKKITNNTVIAVTSNKISFPAAGLLLVKHPEAYLAVNLNTGICIKSKQIEGKWADDSICALEISNQFYRPKNAVFVKDHSLIITYGPSIYANELNSAFRSVILRIISISLYLFPALQRFIKIILARFVMKKQKTSSENEQVVIIDLTSPHFSVKIPENTIIVSRGHYAHMASANYFPGAV